MSPCDDTSSIWGTRTLDTLYSHLIPMGLVLPFPLQEGTMDNLPTGSVGIFSVRICHFYLSYPILPVYFALMGMSIWIVPYLWLVSMVLLLDLCLPYFSQSPPTLYLQYRDTSLKYVLTTLLCNTEQCLVAQLLPLFTSA